MTQLKSRRSVKNRKRPGLTPKQARFVKEYLVDGNGAQAAIRAGYAEKGAAVRGAELLTIRKVEAAVAAGRERIEAKLEVTAERIARELALLGFSNMLDYMGVTGNGSPFVDLSKLTRDQAAALASFRVDEYMDGGGEDARAVKKVEFKLVDKRAALVDLAKLLGYWKEKHEHEAGPSLLEALEAIEAKRRAGA